MTISVAARPLRSAYVAGGKKLRITDITLDNSYPTGGWPVSNAQLGFLAADTIDYVAPLVLSTGHVLMYDYTNKKLKAFSAMGTELANASAALNTVVARVLAVGN